MSYGTKYIVPFRTLSEIPCEIRFDVKNYTGETKELIGGGDPIKIEVDTSDVLIPIRSSSATISVYGSDYLQDLYTSDPFGIKVTLKVDGDIHWVGYVTQDTFSQDYTNPEFIYEIECVAAISVLKHKKFKSDNPTVTFLGIIKDAIALAGYDKAYLTNTVRTTSNGNLFSIAKVASANFFDELDEASTYYEVLEEIAKYTTCTFTPFGADLMLVNYEAIKAGENFYYRIDSGAITAVKFEDVTTVQELGYRGTGATISRIAGKNKAVVNCSLNEIKNLMYELSDEGMIYSSMSEKIQEIKQGKEWVEYRGIARYYSAPIDYNRFKEYMYTGLPNWVGSRFIKYTDFQTKNPPTTLSLVPTIIARRGDTNNLLNGRPIVTIYSKGTLITSSDMYFVLNFEAKVTWNDLFQFAPIDAIKITDDLHLPYKCELKYGDLYYNGTTWVTTKTTFTVNVLYEKGSQFGTWQSVKNENDYNTGLGSYNGKLIKAPTGINIGDVELTICDVIYPTIDGYVIAFMQWTHIKNISLQIATPDAQSIYGDYVDEDSRNDVIYEREIAGDYVEEAEEVDLNISTKTDGKISLSSVFTDNGYITEYKHLGVNIQPEHNIINKIIRLYQQPRFVINPTLANNLKPYSLITDSNLPNVQFINGGGEEDVKMERVTVNLIQI